MTSIINMMTADSLANCWSSGYVDRLFLQHSESIEAWFDLAWQEVRPVFYSSIDLRYAAFKIAPIDTNIFPADFHHLSEKSKEHARNSIKLMLAADGFATGNVLFIIANEDYSKDYFINVQALVSLFVSIGYQVRLGKLDREFVAPERIKIPSGEELTIYPIEHKNNKIFVADFMPDVVLLNNDFAAGFPEVFNDIKQLILPTPMLGWFARRQSRHFKYYEKLATRLAMTIDIDPWHMLPITSDKMQINLHDAAIPERLLDVAEEMLMEINQKYLEYEVIHEPYLVLKSDHCAYTNGVIKINSVQQLKELCVADLQHRLHGLENAAVAEVILQEGVPMVGALGAGKQVVEPVMYACGSNVVGGFFRLVSDFSSKNKALMPTVVYTPIIESEMSGSQYYMFSVISRLAVLAASYERIYGTA
jgi:glutamate--cysteine ligase